LSVVTHGFIGVREMSIEWTWKVSGGEVKLGDMPPDTLRLAFPFGPRSFTSLMICTFMT